MVVDSSALVSRFRLLLLDRFIVAGAENFLISEIGHLELTQDIVELLAHELPSDSPDSSRFFVLNSRKVRVVGVVHNFVHELGDFLVRILGLLLVDEGVVLQLGEGIVLSVLESPLEQLEGIAGVFNLVAGLLDGDLLGVLTRGKRERGRRRVLRSEGGLLLTENSCGEKEVELDHYSGEFNLVQS